MSVGIIDGNVAKMGIASVSIDAASVATITVAEQTFTVRGVRVGDFVAVSKPSSTAGLGVCSARVSAADTVAIQFVNPTAGGIDAAAENYLVFWAHPENAPSGF